jgi:integrase
MADEAGSREKKLVTAASKLVKQRGRQRKTADVGYIFEQGQSVFLRYYTGAWKNGKREQKCQRLGSTSELRTKDQRRKARDKFLGPKITSHGVVHSTMTVGEYYTQKIVPLWDGTYSNGDPSKAKMLKPSTVYGYKKIWRLYLEKPLADITIGDYRTEDATNFLEDLARKGLNTHSLSHVRNVVNIIFSHALSHGVISVNPFTGAHLWVAPKEAKSYVPFTPQQVRDVLVGLTENLQAQTAVGLCYFCALRPGEAAATRWENYNGPHLAITQSSWKGQVGTPKTKESAQTIEVPGPCQELLSRFRESEGNPTSGLILHGVNGGPLNFDYLTREVIRPILDAKHIAWHPLKYFRNDASSHISDATKDGLASAALLRHKTPATTDAFYSKIMDAAKTRAREALEQGFAGTTSKLLASGDVA